MNVFVFVSSWFNFVFEILMWFVMVVFLMLLYDDVFRIVWRVVSCWFCVVGWFGFVVIFEWCFDCVFVKWFFLIVVIGVIEWMMKCLWCYVSVGLGSLNCMLVVCFGFKWLWFSNFSIVIFLVVLCKIFSFLLFLRGLDVLFNSWNVLF